MVKFDAEGAQRVRREIKRPVDEDQKDAYPTSAYGPLIAQRSLYAVEVGSSAWGEIDSIDDHQHALERVVPQTGMMTRPQVWIDATEVSGGRQLWGMTLVERQVREMALRGCAYFRLFTTPQTTELVAAVRPDLHQLYQVEIEMVEVVAGCEIFSQFDRADGGLIFLSGDAVYDGRVLDYVVEEGSGHAVTQGARGALFLSQSEETTTRRAGRELG